MPRACDSVSAPALPATRRRPIAAGPFSSCNRCSLKFGGFSLAAIVAAQMIGCLLSIALPIGMAVVSFSQAGRVSAPLSACAAGGGLVACPRVDRAAVIVLRGAR